MFSIFNKILVFIYKFVIILFFSKTGMLKRLEHDLQLIVAVMQWKEYAVTNLNKSFKFCILTCQYLKIEMEFVKFWYNYNLKINHYIVRISVFKLYCKNKCIIDYVLRYDWLFQEK